MAAIASMRDLLRRLDALSVKVEGNYVREYNITVANNNTFDTMNYYREYVKVIDSVETEFVTLSVKQYTDNGKMLFYMEVEGCTYVHRDGLLNGKIQTGQRWSVMSMKKGLDLTFYCDDVLGSSNIYSFSFTTTPATPYRVDA